MNVLAGFVRNRAGNRLISDSTAIDDSRVHIQIHLIEQIVQRVRRKVTAVRLLAANQSGSVAIVVVKRNFGFSNLLLQGLIHLIDPLVLVKGERIVGDPLRPHVKP